MKLLALLVLSGCVLDRTGQSATEAYRREMAIQVTRTKSLQTNMDEAMVRVQQLEDVTRARGQEEILRLETLDQLRIEVSNLRGEMEVFRYEAGLITDQSGRFLDDAEYRLAYLEVRAQALEKAMGLEPPDPPEKPEPELVENPDTVTPENPENPDPLETTEELTPEALFELGKKHLDADNTQAARAVFERFLRDNPNHERVPEASYRIAETKFREGDYQPAILAYQEIIDKFGTTSWAPWAMLRQGESFLALGQKDNAQLFFEEVLRLYPRSTAAKEAKSLKGR